MASAVHSLRLSLRAAVGRAVAPTPARPRQLFALRRFSSSPFQRLPAVKKGDVEVLNGEEELDRDDDSLGLGVDVEDMDAFEDAVEAHEWQFDELDEQITESERMPKNTSNSLYFEDDEEEDPDATHSGMKAHEFDDDDMMTIAHGKLDELREYREYARIAAWQMPLLSKLATPFEPPTAQQPLRFRYTSYMGEFHPAEKKVVVEFSPRDLPLTEAQRQKFRKLLGPRLNPETDIAKMSCELFEHQAQNKRYLGDLVNKLVAQAKDSKDMFEDIPLDTRHHTFKVKPRFPKEWRLTEERRKELEDTRQQALLLDETKEADGTLVDGDERIQKLFKPAGSTSPIPERVPVSIGIPSPRPAPLWQRTARR